MSVSGTRPVDESVQSAVCRERLAGALAVDRATATAIRAAIMSRIFIPLPSVRGDHYGPVKRRIEMPKRLSTLVCQLGRSDGRRHIELGGFHSLGVLIELRPPGSPCHGDHFRVGQ